jgi:hypothetical protein
MTSRDPPVKTPFWQSRNAVGIFRHMHFLREKQGKTEFKRSVAVLQSAFCCSRVIHHAQHQKADHRASGPGVAGASAVDRGARKSIPDQFH